MYKSIFTIGFFLIASVAMMGQKTFQGTINYKISVSGEGAEGMEAFMPNAMEIAILKKDISVHIKGGMMEMLLGRIFTQGKSGKSYMVKDSEKTAYEMPADKPEEKTSTTTATKEDEVLTICGYRCQKYKIVTLTDGEESISYSWNTEDFVFPSSQKGGFSGYLQNKAPGAPLKIEVQQNGMNMAFVAETINTQKPNKNLFVVPKGYKTAPLEL